MKLRYRITGTILVLVAITITSLAIVISHDTECPLVPVLSADAELMKAIVYRCYGSPEVLSFEDVEKPVPDNDEVLVRIHAAAVNPLDWHYMRGSPYVMRLMGSGIGAPSSTKMGVDFAGTIEAVGKNVERFKPGDEVFGGRDGAFAEYIVVREDRAIAPKPANMTFEQAASVPIAAITALQALRDTGNVKPGQKVLINGASGGVGTFAVQIARSYGAEVTGVCSTRNLETVRSLGAHHVIDYKKQSYTEGDEKYDLIIDNVGNHSLLANKGVMSSDATLVMVGGESGNWLGPLMRPIKGLMLSPFVNQEFAMFLAQMNQQDLGVLGELMRSGKMTPVIDKRYRLDEVADAIRYSEEGHARGKIIINIH